MVGIKILFMLELIVCAALSENLDLCSQNHRTITYDSWAEEKREWNLLGNNCTSVNSVLLLKLIKMKFVYSSYCRGYLKISGTDICTFKSGDCFLIANPSTSIDGYIAQTAECKRIYWIFREDTLPVLITYSGYYHYRNYRKIFTIDVNYTSEAIEDYVTTTPTPIIETTTGFLTTEEITTTNSFTTPDTTPQREYSSQAPQKSSVDITVPVILGILLGIVLIILFAVVIRCLKIKRELQELQSAQYTTVTPVVNQEVVEGSTNMSPYELVDEHVAGSSRVVIPKETHRGELEAQYSVIDGQTKSANANGEREIVVNALYRL